MQVIQKRKHHHSSGLVISAVVPAVPGHGPGGTSKSLPRPDSALSWGDQVYLHNSKAALCPPVSAVPVYWADL